MWGLGGRNGGGLLIDESIKLGRFLQDAEGEWTDRELMISMGSNRSGMRKLDLEAEEEERGGGEDEDEDEDEDEEEMRILGALRWAEIWDAVEVTPERSDIKCRSVEDDDVGIQEGLKNLTIHDKNNAPQEESSKEDDPQDSQALEENDNHGDAPRNFSKVWKFVQNHPKELIIRNPSEKICIILHNKNDLHFIMVRIRGGFVSAGRTTRFRSRDEDNEIIEPSATKSPKRVTKKHGEKGKGSAQKKHSEERQTTSAKQTALPPVSDSEEELEQSTNVDTSVTKSPRKGTEPHSKKGKWFAKKKGTAQTKERQTADPSVEQIEEQQTVEQNAENQQATETSTRKSPRTMSGGQTDCRENEVERENELLGAT
ncbi:uncharacterized protein LOC113780402 [Coffea eugenioides]|uniref:uncharacterized protein LOC113780402 n=1 Tax=Coffea eugenioides TaxID=49369 RepID=UPI000F61561E|nr:uncharacterized protein LOC113780402 [Coffea eugenioides]